MKKRFKILCIGLFGFMIFLSILGALIRHFVTHRKANLTTYEMGDQIALFEAKPDFKKYDF